MQHREFRRAPATTPIDRSLSKSPIKLVLDPLSFNDIPLKDLPLHSYEFDASYPPEGSTLKQPVEAFDVLLFIPPEHHRCILGVSKNFIGWGSRPWCTSAFARKPTGIIDAFFGAIGTAAMQSNCAASGTS